MTDEEYIEACKNWIAARKAWIDQVEKRFQDQYPLRHPFDNKHRMEDLEAQKFIVEVHEWELEQFIASREEKE